MIERQNNYIEKPKNKENLDNFNKEKKIIISLTKKELSNALYDTKKSLSEESKLMSRLRVDWYEYYYNNTKVIKLTKQILDLYDKKYKGKNFYVTESSITKWDPEINNNAEMIIKIDKIWYDTTILSDSWFQKVFWVNSWRKDFEEMKNYVKYLNIVKDKK